MEAHVIFQPKPGNPVPLFTRGPNQGQPCSAFIWLNLESGAIGASHNMEMNQIQGCPVGSGFCDDDGSPGLVTLGIIRRWRIRSDLKAEDIASVLDHLVPVMQQILDGSTVTVSGEDVEVQHTAEVDKILSSGDVDDMIAEFTADMESAQIEDLREWLLDGGAMPDNETDPETFIEEAEADIRNSEMVTLATVREELISIWRGADDAGEPLPAQVREFVNNH